MHACSTAMVTARPPATSWCALRDHFGSRSRSGAASSTGGGAEITGRSGPPRARPRPPDDLEGPPRLPTQQRRRPSRRARHRAPGTAVCAPPERLPHGSPPRHHASQTHERPYRPSTVGEFEERFVDVGTSPYACRQAPPGGPQVEGLLALVLSWLGYCTMGCAHQAPRLLARRAATPTRCDGRGVRPGHPPLSAASSRSRATGRRPVSPGVYASKRRRPVKG